MIVTTHLFRPLAHELIRLLRDLDATDWQRGTSAAAWRVRDVVAHLLDVDLRRISAARDGFVPRPPRPLSSTAALVGWLDELNGAWVGALQRLSPRVLIELLEVATGTLADVMDAADPGADALFPVAWAGHERSPMWLDIGREYTERWHHQDQIREAVGAPPLRSRSWLAPVLDISVLALPHAYRDVTAPRGTEVRIRSEGDVAAEWHLVRADDWVLAEAPASPPACVVTAADLDFARLLLHRLSPGRAREVVNISGDAALAAPLLAARAVMV